MEKFVEFGVSVMNTVEIAPTDERPEGPHSLEQLLIETTTCLPFLYFEPGSWDAHRQQLSDWNPNSNC